MVSIGKFKSNKELIIFNPTYFNPAFCFISINWLSDKIKNNKILNDQIYSLYIKKLSSIYYRALLKQSSSLLWIAKNVSIIKNSMLLSLISLIF